MLKRERVGFVPALACPGHPDAGLGPCMPFPVSTPCEKKEAAWEALQRMANAELGVETAADPSDPDAAEIIVAHTARFENGKGAGMTGGLPTVGLQGPRGARSMPRMTEWPRAAPARRGKCRGDIPILRRQRCGIWVSAGASWDRLQTDLPVRGIHAAARTGIAAWLSALSYGRGW